MILSVASAFKEEEKRAQSPVLCQLLGSHQVLKLASTLCKIKCTKDFLAIMATYINNPHALPPPGVMSTVLRPVSYQPLNCLTWKVSSLRSSTSQMGN